MPLFADVCNIAAGVYIMMTTMWTIGITTTVTQFVKPPPYLFSDTATALLYLAPMIGSVGGEVFGHFFNDWLCNRYIRTHNGVYKQENRLWGTWPATALAITALVLYGQTLQHELSWVGLAIGWGLESFAVLSGTVAISAYVLDCFPDHAALASSWINFWRTTGKIDANSCTDRQASLTSCRWLLRNLFPSQMGRPGWRWHCIRLSSSSSRSSLLSDHRHTAGRTQMARSILASRSRELSEHSLHTAI